MLQICSELCKGEHVLRLNGLGLDYWAGLQIRQFRLHSLPDPDSSPVAHCAAYAVRLMSNAWCLLLKMSDQGVGQMCTKFWMSTYHDRLLLATCTCSAAAARQHVTIPSTYDDLTVSAFASSPGLRNKNIVSRHRHWSTTGLLQQRAWHMHRSEVTSFSAKGMQAATGCKLLRAAPLAAVSSRKAFRRQTFASASRALRASSPFRVQRSADTLTTSSHSAARQMRCAASSGGMSTGSSEAYNKLQNTKVEPCSVFCAYDHVHLTSAAARLYQILAAGRWMSITQACFCSIIMQGRSCGA